MLTKFAAGQIWKYKNRKDEDESRIIVGRVDTEDEDLGPVIHISITELKIPNPTAPDGLTKFVGHMPFDNETLEESVTELISENEGAVTEHFDEGYGLWKAAFDKGEAGVFTVPVVDAIKFVQETVAG